MIENCTIYCKHLDKQYVGELISEMFSVEAHRQLASVNFANDSIEMTLNFKQFEQPGDSFCKLLLSTCAHIESNADTNSELVQQLISHIEECDYAIGVVVSPSMTTDERIQTLMFKIAESSDGVIFNGNCFLTLDGDVIET